MHIEKIDLKELVLDPDNARKHDAKNLKAIKASLEKFGQQKPIIVDANGVIIAGNGTYSAAKSLKWKEINIIRTELTGADAKAYALADNRTAELAAWDIPNLSEALNSLIDIDFDIGSLGFDDKFMKENEIKTGESASEHGEVKELVKMFSDEEIIEDAFEYFRASGFPYPNLELFEMKMALNKLKNLPLAMCVNSNVGYRIPDTFNKHRFSAAAINMNSPVDAFADDKKLKKAIRMSLENSEQVKNLSYINLVSGTQSCSNFRPAFARMLYETYARPGATVFDSSTGYGGRLTGFLASHCQKYIGTDPNVPTYEANCLLAETLKKDKEVVLYNSPIEDLDIREHIGECDFAFTSPPYFVKEIYSTDSTQSCMRYSEYDSWINDFLKQMLIKNYEVLKSDAYCVINIEDVKVKGKTYALVEPTIELCKEIGFEFIELKKFNLPARTFIRDGDKITEEAFESVIVFKKV